MSGNLTIGKRIALLRKAKSLTQQRLSELTGKSRGVIAQIEKDMVKPDYEFIGLFVRKLNIPNGFLNLVKLSKIGWLGE